MFPKGDINRVWLVLGALDSLEKTTLVNIANVIGMPKSTVNDVLIKLVKGQVAGVTVIKVKAEYKITEWLNFRNEVRKIYIDNT